ncbi:unnamed protein product [Didymodactylos carnosus]|uniref:Uncharacterized protein n=1 Tax=Didymodactylos carnosus TaxID=1234261 RepID=A0A8S2Z6K2_9BILA|nr:unnamed protein product [Didymodactylos carnosus]
MMPHMIGIPPPNSVQIPMHFNIPPPMPPASQQQTMSMHFPPAHIPAPVPPPSHTTNHHHHQQQRAQMQVGPNPLNESITMTNAESENPMSDQWSKQAVIPTLPSRHEWNSDWRPPAPPQQQRRGEVDRCEEISLRETNTYL